MARSPQAGSSRDVEQEPELPPPLARLSSLLDEKPEALATGDEDIRAASLAAAKFVFDQALKTEPAAERHIVPFLSSLQPSGAPKTRSQTRAEAAGKGKGKGKQKADDVGAGWRATSLDALYVDGAEDEQVWAQLDLRAAVLCDMLGRILEDEPEDDEDGAPKVVDEDDDAMDEDVDGFDVGDDAMLDKLGGSSDDDDGDSEPGSSELDALLSSDSSDGEHSEPEHEQDLRDPSDDDSDAGSDAEVDLDGKGTGKTKTGRKSVLDDGFFSLADFNAEADAAEARSRSSGRLGDDDSDEEDEDVDIFASVDAAGAFDEDDLDESGELYYKDFFDPPSRKALAAAAKSTPPKKKKKAGFQSENDGDPPAGKPERKRTVQFHDKVRVKPIKPSPLRRRNLLLEKLMKEQGYTPGLASLDDDDDSDEDEEGDGEGMDWDAEGSSTEEEEEEDGEDEEDSGRAAIERLKDDLFADDDDASGPSDMSTHEKRVAELRAQIAALEEENVAPRAWALMGEAGARARPANALLEEDLEFDRAARPVPAVTEEKVAGLEEMIKQRILENTFDDVERKRPESELAPSRRAQFEISDQKSQKSLAQLYEDEYSAAASGTATVDDRDGKLAKEHKELEKLWDGICYKLDALCNAHFTPKAPTAKITTIANVPAASLESALPTATAAAAMLAPEEVAARATGRALVAKSEMTPEEKRRVRSREKARRRKRDKVVAAQGKVAQIGGANSKPSRGSVRKEKEKALSAVTKGRGVTVVGKANGRDAKSESHSKGKPLPPADGKKLKL
ncbi:Mpp10 protein [Auricularia subglabra TFB-10046 SS5]|nr:Mpp10 protein [Auricularia subglabra TFB-10046 SS5]